MASEAEAEMGAAVAGAAEKPERPDYFKNVVIVLLTFVSVFVAAVTFLQNYASLRSSDLGEQSYFQAVNATGLLFSAGLKSAQGDDALQRYGDAIQKAVQADTKAKALLMGGKADVAAQSQLDVERWQQAAVQIAQQTDVIKLFHSDTALY